MQFHPQLLPSIIRRVNSRELRRVVEDAIENAEVKPNVIRFFRGAMFNMVRFLPTEIKKYRIQTIAIIIMIFLIGWKDSDCISHFVFGNKSRLILHCQMWMQLENRHVVALNWHLG